MLASLPRTPIAVVSTLYHRGCHCVAPLNPVFGLQPPCGSYLVARRATGRSSHILAFFDANHVQILRLTYALMFVYLHMLETLLSREQAHGRAQLRPARLASIHARVPLHRFEDIEQR